MNRHLKHSRLGASMMAAALMAGCMIEAAGAGEVLVERDMARMARAPTMRIPASITREVTNPSARVRLTRRATG